MYTLRGTRYAGYRPNHLVYGTFATIAQALAAALEMGGGWYNVADHTGRQIARLRLFGHPNPMPPEPAGAAQPVPAPAAA